MYSATFRISSDGESALLRIDVFSAPHSANYTLTDSNGSEHSWTWLLDEGQCVSFLELARYALSVYLVDAVDRGWTGNIVIVHCAYGFVPCAYDDLIAKLSFFTANTVPDGITVQ